jgi:hypothetical protein
LGIKPQWKKLTGAFGKMQLTLKKIAPGRLNRHLSHRQYSLNTFGSLGLSRQLTRANLFEKSAVFYLAAESVLSTTRFSAGHFDGQIKRRCVANH